MNGVTDVRESIEVAAMIKMHTHNARAAMHSLLRRQHRYRKHIFIVDQCRRKRKIYFQSKYNCSRKQLENDLRQMMPRYIDNENFYMAQFTSLRII